MNNSVIEPWMTCKGKILLETFHDAYLTLTLPNKHGMDYVITFLDASLESKKDDSVHCPINYKWIWTGHSTHIYVISIFYGKNANYFDLWHQMFEILAEMLDFE